jgi:hypothetical protein
VNRKATLYCVVFGGLYANRKRRDTGKGKAPPSLKPVFESRSCPEAI